MLLPADRRRYWLALSLVLLAAFALRLGALLLEWDVHHADEVFQVLEPAHRLVFGTGIVAWEWEYGVRSWILPGLFAGIMALARPLGDDPESYLFAIRVACILVSLAAPAAAFVLGHRRFGLTGAVLAAALPAIWVDMVYFSSHTLSEPFGAHVWLAGVALAGTLRPRPWQAAIAGALVLLALLIRLQLAPVVLLALLWFAWARPAIRAPLLLGAGAMLLLGGVVDTVTWGLPWQPIWRTLELHLVYRVHESFSIDEAWWYGARLVYYLGAGAVVLGALALFGVREAWLIALAALVVLLAHSAIAHKEYRFIYPAIAFASVVAGLGLARVAAAQASPWLPAGAVAGVALVSLATAVSPGYERYVRQNVEPVLPVARAVRALPELCGVGFRTFWSHAGGHALIHRPVPFYDASTPASWARYHAGFNAVVYDADDKPAPELGFAEVACFRALCVGARPGGCAPVPAWRNDWRPQPLRGLPP